ncbi:MAG: hypothetical protein NC548_66200 [Lachnospiraceae bacterium]|nr:hypothetical protein [Lachnospiraceae bacterium]
MIKIDIHINKNILDKILNDDMESDLQEIIKSELSKTQTEMNLSKIADCINAIILLRDENNII